MNYVPASSFNKIQSLIVARAIVAIMVMLWHLSANISLDKYFNEDFYIKIFGFGNARVIFFFVLSGFIIMLVHLIDMFNTRKSLDFLLRRIIRIYPIYWLIFGIMFAAIISGLFATSKTPIDYFLILKGLLLFPLDSTVVGGTGAPVLVVAWTLQYEMFFYALFALAIASRWLAAIVVCFLVIGFLARMVFATLDFPAVFIWSDYTLVYLFGIASALLYKRTQIFSDRFLSVIIFGILMLLFPLFSFWIFGVQTSDLNNYIYGFGSACLMLGLARLEQSGKRLYPFLNTRFIERLSNASYFLYLIHFPIISLVCKLVLYAGFDGFLGATMTFFMSIVVCISAALYGNERIEKPLVKWLGSSLRSR